MDKLTPENDAAEVIEEPAEEEDFAALLEASEDSRDGSIRRDKKAQGTVVSIGEEWIFVDVGAKTEGTISKSELLDKDGNVTVRIGDTITAYVVSTKGGEILLSVHMTSAASEEAIRGAFQSGVPVECLVTEERKGGYGVSLFGRPAFCPYSQMDLHSPADPSAFVGQRLLFKITEYSDRGRNIVVSRRKLLEEERAEQVEQLKKELKVGDTVSGTVANLTSFGAFVDIGGIEGLIPISEIAWHRVASPADVLQRGEQLTVKVLDLDWQGERISLSRKQVLEDPWDSVSDRYHEESVVKGTIAKLMDFGAFVELEPGVEGLIHISNLGAGRRIKHPKEVVSEGDDVEVRILSVDQKARRIGLELTFQGEGGRDEGAVRPGSLVTGIVDSVMDYGLFVSLPGGRSGLLHISEMDNVKRADLRRRFPVGSEVEVEILAIDPESGKISLSTRQIALREEKARAKEFSGKGRGKSFGTLGDLLKDKLQK